MSGNGRIERNSRSYKLSIYIRKLKIYLKVLRFIEKFEEISKYRFEKVEFRILKKGTRKRERE